MKIALIRLHKITHECDDGYYDEEFIGNHITDFVKVTEEEYDALHQFVGNFNRRSKGSARFILVEDETEKLPKTIAEALEFAAKKKAEWAARERQLEKERKERKRKAEERKKRKKDETVAALAAQVEKYKAKIKELEGE